MTAVELPILLLKQFPECPKNDQKVLDEKVLDE